MGGMIAQFHKIVTDVPPLSPAVKSNETAQLDSADAQIRAHLMFWITRMPTVTDDQRIQAYLRAITVQEVQTMLTADEQTRAAAGMVVPDRLNLTHIVVMKHLWVVCKEIRSKHLQFSNECGICICTQMPSRQRV